jgi:F0F1-type ATP synthase assembly protein I
MSEKGKDRQNGGSDSGSLRALALATQLGFAVAGPLVVFLALGVWADGQFGTRPWLFFVGLMLGIASAGAAFYQIATSIPAKKYVPTAKKPSAPEAKPPEDDDTDSWYDGNDQDGDEDNKP